MSIRKRLWNKQTVWIHDHINPATGKRTQPVIRDHLGVPVKSKAAAERIAAVQYAAAVTAAAESPAAVLSEIVTPADVLNEYKERPAMSQASMRMERIQADHLKRILPDLPIARLTADDLEQYAAARQAEYTGAKTKKHVSGATVRKELALLAAAVKYCNRKGVCSVTLPPMPSIVTEEYMPRILTREELAALLKGCGDDDNPLRQVVEFCYLAGLRRAELYRLTWREVDFENQRLVFITQKRGGSAVKRRTTVYLTDRAVHLLRLRKETATGELVFGVPTYAVDGVETNVDPSIITKIRGAARRAKLQKPRSIGLHSLRHACASHLIEAGATIPEVAAHLRHRDGGALLLRTYAHTHEAALRRASALLSSPTTDECNKNAT